MFRYLDLDILYFNFQWKSIYFEQMKANYRFHRKNSNFVALGFLKIYDEHVIDLFEMPKISPRK